jgi:biopolymer transport protein ExbD
MIDSMLTMEINKYKATVDTPTVVINADTSAFYGEVFRIMRLSKKSGAKVVANIK